MLGLAFIARNNATLQTKGAAVNESDDFFYANAMELAVSPYDFSLRFIRNAAGQVALPEGVRTGEVPVVTRASMTVGMSPTHAKAMLPALVNAVLRYEEQLGKLTIPQEMQTAFDALFKGKAS